MVTTVSTAALFGLDGFEVNVECNCEKGIPEIAVIGLPDTSVRESVDRIRSAAENNALPFIRCRTTINLAPADKKKTGAYFDLPILLSILKHNELQNAFTDDACFVGELSLKGEIRRVDGALAMCLTARNAGKKRIFLPFENAPEASFVDGVEVYGMRTLRELLDHLTGKEVKLPVQRERLDNSAFVPEIDFSEIKGQEYAKRAMEIAAVGAHNILLIGPPGAGKSMLSKALAGILPDLTFEEMIETTNIHSVSGVLPENTHLITRRPVRSPHHTVSHIGIVGGGVTPNPGEVTLAHNGVLFLDELPEFEKKTLEVLRQPLEDGKITVTRAGYKLTYPSRFMLVAAMNPCPCGYFGSSQKLCTCRAGQIHKYVSKISGPLLDRIDIQIEVPAIKFDEMNDGEKPESSAVVKARVNEAREFRRARLERLGLDFYSRDADKKEFCNFTPEADVALKKAFDTLVLSARGYTRTVSVARTIADREKSDEVMPYHVYEALRLRQLDRKYFENS